MAKCFTLKELIFLRGKNLLPQYFPPGKKRISLIFKYTPITTTC